MNWRKICRKLLLASILLLFFVWSLANNQRTRYTFGTETRFHGISLRSGSLELSSAPQRETGARLDSWFEVMRLTGGFRYSWGHWSFTETPVNRRADYSTGPPAPGMPPPLMVEDRMWTLQVPVWVLWFPVAAFIVAFCRIMENRAAARKAKALAEGSVREPDPVSDADTQTPDEVPVEEPGSAAGGPLAVAAALLLMNCFTASTPGGYAPLFAIASAFAIWGLREARTPTQRTIGLVLTGLCVTSTVMDFLHGMMRRY